MKVLFLPPYSLPVATGGFESQVYHIYRALLNKGVAVQWYSFDRIDTTSFDIIHLWSTDISMIPVARIFKNTGIPVVLTPMAGSQRFSNSVLNLFNLLSKIPFVCAGERSIRYLYGLMDYFFPLTPFEEKRLKDVYSVSQARITMIPNGLDEAFFTNREDAVEFPFDDFILSIGRIEPNKNQMSLIEAVTNLGLNLIIVGGDGLDVEYVKKCKSIAGANVYYWGLERNQYKLKALYKKAKLTVIPSYSEMAPLVAFESLAVGTPVICTNKCGLYGGTYQSITFTDVDAASLKKTISRVKANPMDVVREGVFSWSEVADRYIDSYKRIVEKNAINQ